MQRIHRVLVLGGGSAGFLAAIAIKTKLPHLQVTVVRSKEIGVIGVGESTTPYTPDHLHGYLKLDLGEFYRLAKPSFKLGIKFLWGPRPYFNYTYEHQCDSQFQVLKKPTGYYYGHGDFIDPNISSALMTQDKAFLRQEGNIPYISRELGYHLENVTYVGYLETVATRLGVTILEDKVIEVLQSESAVTGLRLESGRTEGADFFIDCSGFRSILLGAALAEPYISFQSSLYCNRALIGGWHRGANEPILPYTVAETMNAGWCWQIDHEHLINRGYVYSSDFISDDEAEREFRAKNPKVEETKIIPFRSGRYERAWVKNVVGIGNSAGFVEPLESTALVVICADTQAIAESLIDCDCMPTPALAREYNDRNARSWDTIRDFLAVHYRFNTRLQTPFWKASCADVDLAGAAEIVDYYRQLGPSTLWKNTLIDPIDSFKMDGYYTLLVGQAVSHERPYEPSLQEREICTRIQTAYRKKAADAFSVEETFQVIRRPEWQWSQEFYLSQRHSNG